MSLRVTTLRRDCIEKLIQPRNFLVFDSSAERSRSTPNPRFGTLTDKNLSSINYINLNI